MVQWQIAIDVIQDVRGTIGMYLFIIEESIQTLGMALYIYNKQKKYDKVREIAQWGLDNLILPAKTFCDQYGAAAYPLNISYKLFYESAEKTFRAYLSQTGE